jgi:5'-nucleotidase
MKLSHRIVVSGIFTFILSCAHSSRPVETSEKVSTLSNDRYETVAIIGLNDIHGALSAEKLRTKDAPQIPYERGGAVTISSQIKVMRKELGSRLLVLDGGDHFQGSIDSNLFEGKPMVEFFRTIGLNAAVVGNHEFDFGPEGTTLEELKIPEKERDNRGVLKKRIQEAPYPYLAANIYSKKTGFPGVPGTKASVILNAGKLKIGVIGLTTLDTPITTRAEYVKGLEFKDMAKITIEEARKLRKDGAQVILALTHAGLFCNGNEGSGKVAKTSPIKSESDIQTECDEKEEIPQLLKKLPKGTIDAVVSGHTHSLVHHWINGVPVIQSGTRNYYFTTLYLTYDWKDQKVARDLTKIEGPVPICPKVFENQRNCSGELPAPKVGRGELVTPIFHGEPIHEDSEMKSALAPYFEKTEEAKKEVVGEAARPIEHLKKEESPFGNFVADAMRASVKADFAIMNEGGIRTGLPSGKITFEDLFRAMPFGNYVSLVQVTGKQLKDLLRVATNGWRGYFPTSGLKLRVIDLAYEPQKNDWNGDGSQDYWEANRLIEVRTSSGEAIDDQREYKVALIDFLVTGGDGMGFPISRIPANKIQLIAGPQLLDVVADAIRVQKVINTEKNPLVAPNSPRLIREAAPKKMKTSKRASKSRRKKK